ncbi:hypothetical protein BGZ46_004474, partial [Entomortierella lignicola]
APADVLITPTNTCMSITKCRIRFSAKKNSTITNASLLGEEDDNNNDDDDKLGQRKEQ